MGRLAYLPDSSTLAELFQRVRAESPQAAGKLLAPSAAAEPRREEAHGPPTPRAEPLRELTAASPQPAGDEAHGPPTPRAQAPRELESIEQALLGARSLDARFTLFAKWVERLARAQAVFVADADGLAMVESTAREGYLVAAGEIAGVLQDVAALLPDVDDGGTSLRLKSSGSVELIWSKTPFGRFTVGLLVEQPLDRDSISIIRAALRRVVAP